MKKLFIFLFVTILSCNTTSVNKQYINDSNSNITTPKNNKSKSNNISNDNNLITDKYEILYNSVKEGLELYGCQELKINYDDFWLVYFNFEKDIKESSNFYEFVKKGYLDSYKKRFTKTESYYSISKEHFYCFYCESIKDALREIKFSLTEIKRFFIKYDGSSVFVSDFIGGFEPLKLYNPTGNSAINFDLSNNKYQGNKKNFFNDNGLIKRKTIYVILGDNVVKPLKIDNKFFFSCKVTDFYFDKKYNYLLFFIKSNQFINFEKFNSLADQITVFSSCCYEKNNIYDTYNNKIIKIYDSNILMINLNNSAQNNEIFVSYLYKPLDNDKLKAILINNKIYINSLPYVLTQKFKYNQEIFKKLLEIDFSSKEITEDLKSLSPYVKFNENVIVEDNLIQEITDMKANSKGEIIILDNINKIIWRVVPFKLIEKIAGKRINYKNGDKNILNFINPEFIDIDKDDNIYVLDKGRKEILKIPDDRKLEEKKNYSIFYKQFGDKVKVKIDEHQNYDH